MRRRDLLRCCAVGALGILGVGACAKNDEPRDPVWSKTPCAHCAMLVSERRYAAQLVASGDREYFDDIGCMVLWLEEHGRKAERTWVYEGASARWIDASTARYAPAAKTPMDFGFEAKSSEGVGWEEMRDRVVAKQRSTP